MSRVYWQIFSQSVSTGNLVKTEVKMDELCSKYFKCLEAIDSYTVHLNFLTTFLDLHAVCLKLRL